jgi:uncharacterized protein YjbI with pentapeptide repeats
MVLVAFVTFVAILNCILLIINYALFRQFAVRIFFYDTAALVIGWVMLAYQADGPGNYITTNSGKVYTISTCAPKSTVYMDRGYTFVSVPRELNGAVLIQTANSDKMSDQNNLFAIHIANGKSAKIYLLMDGRLFNGNPPAAFRNYKRVELSEALHTTDKQAHYVAYTSTLAAADCKLQFEGNLFSMPPQKNNAANFSMYMVMIGGVDAAQITNGDEEAPALNSSFLLIKPKDSTHFEQQIIQHRRWLQQGADNSHRLDLSSKKIKGISCYNATLQYADLSGTTFDSVNFCSSVLKEIEYSGSKLIEVNFYNSYLDSANFNGTSFTDCSFIGADLRRAIFTDVKFKHVDFTHANVSGMIFEPDSLPDVEGMASADNLDSLSYRTNPAMLIKLQAEFKTAGFYRAQRQITAAIERRKHELNPDWITRTIDGLLFDATSDYGLKPFRPLMIMIVLIYLFYRVYLLLFFAGKLKIEIRHPAENDQGTDTVVNDSIHPGRLVFLSIITAFAIGFGEYNINEWAKKLLREEYDIRGFGWTRVILGIQNLLSLFLFSLTVILLLANPFG